MILSQMNKYQDCHSVLNILPEILYHFGISKREQDRLRQMQKAKHKAESSSRASESTAFIHVIKKGTVRMRKERRQREQVQGPFAGSSLPLMFPYKLKFQIITFQTHKVIWQLTLNIEGHWVQFTFNTPLGVWSQDKTKSLASWAAVCLTNAPLRRRPVPRSFSNFIQSPTNGRVHLTTLTEVRLWYFLFSRHTLWGRNNLTHALGSHPCWPCVWGKAVVSTWSAEG